MTMSSQLSIFTGPDTNDTEFTQPGPAFKRCCPFITHEACAYGCVYTTKCASLTFHQPTEVSSCMLVEPVHLAPCIAAAQYLTTTGCDSRCGASRAGILVWRNALQEIFLQCFVGYQPFTQGFLGTRGQVPAMPLSPAHHFCKFLTTSCTAF